MPRHTIDVFTVAVEMDPEGRSFQAALEALGTGKVESVKSVHTYEIEADLDAPELESIIRLLFHDPVVYAAFPREEWTPQALLFDRVGERPADHFVHIERKPGVMDPVEETVIKAVRDVLDKSPDSVRTSRRLLVWGGVSAADIQALATRTLANPVIEDVAVDTDPPPREQPMPRSPGEATAIPLAGADDRALDAISAQRALALSTREMQAVRDYFKGENREPNDVELDTIAQTWSEHCKHKTLTSKVDWKGEIIDDPLNRFIKRATREAAKKWCVSVFTDNAGVIEYDNKNSLCFKVETHNHPSAIEPYGGAGTGLGGVIRDILGTGLGAKPIMSTDVFCFGPPNMPMASIPAGAIHPQRMIKEVVAGVRDYGNRMGIPTSAGAVFFDERYATNPLVFCGTVGILPTAKAHKAAVENDLAVVVGGRTGRDGLGGATFSSASLDESSETESAGAVQIGNPITEKKMLDALLVARDRDLYHDITDCGAGGLSSAFGEMGERLGVEIELDKVPLKYAGLSPREVWLSEAQERMALAVPEENAESLIEVFESEGVPATVIGKFTGKKRLTLTWNGAVVADLAMKFLHDGLPRVTRAATWKRPDIPRPERAEKEDYTEDLKGILGAWNVCSREWIIRQYDHEVQGGSVIKPLTGPARDGPSDAVVFSPLPGRKRGVAVGMGMNPLYGDVDPFLMACSAVDEALRNVVAAGATPAKVALLDNFSWGDTSKPDRLGALMRALEGCYQAARAYDLPFISGKDSLNNEFVAAGESRSIPHSLLISAIAVVPDIAFACSMDLKRAGSLLYLVGETWEELGGSHYDMINGLKSPDLPLFSGECLDNFLALHEAISSGHVLSCHDLAEGGLAAALAEMCLAGGLGADIHLSDLPREIDLDNVHGLFAESNSRFLVEVPLDSQDDFETFMDGAAFAPVGYVTEEPRMIVHSFDASRTVIDAVVAELKEAWKHPLSKALG